MATYLIVWGCGTSIDLCHRADKKKTHEVPKIIPTINQEGDTWRKDKYFRILTLGDTRGCVVRRTKTPEA
jgi:hypothetical protein